MPNGYTGKILHVDLTNATLEVEEPKEAFYRKYLGGSAMGMHYILRDMPKGAMSEGMFLSVVCAEDMPKIQPGEAEREAKGRFLGLHSQKRQGGTAVNGWKYSERFLRRCSLCISA